ncbi:hypothetical protein [Sphingosinicella rhizophila]|uniref:Uncharacterized protein n=1 Tax=Sphingosinicella rhizophila TaxID=3050082 RepID=A0ABU3Q9T7_9SPHN|nr:hypothetical protein [Sphingosinicella sp. GR2756]MDT9600164.1 hypothetical protein [Sphingosinicella sp. GR2756]
MNVQEIKTVEQVDNKADRFDALMCCVGHLLYEWSMLEKALVDEIRRFRTKGGDTGTSLRIRSSATERLAEWRALLSRPARRDQQLADEVADLSSSFERLRRDRNLIAHHFEGAAEAADTRQPFITCGMPHAAGSGRDFARADLLGMIDQIRNCGARLTKLGAKVREES